MQNRLAMRLLIRVLILSFAIRDLAYRGAEPVSWPAAATVADALSLRHDCRRLDFKARLRLD